MNVMKICASDEFNFVPLVDILIKDSKKQPSRKKKQFCCCAQTEALDCKCLNFALKVLI